MLEGLDYLSSLFIVQFSIEKELRFWKLIISISNITEHTNVYGKLLT